MKRLSIIVPCYNEQETIDIYLQEMKQVESNMRDTMATKIILL